MTAKCQFCNDPRTNNQINTFKVANRLREKFLNSLTSEEHAYITDSRDEFGPFDVCGPCMQKAITESRFKDFELWARITSTETGEIVVVTLHLPNAIDDDDLMEEILQAFDYDWDLYELEFIELGPIKGGDIPHA